MIKDWKLEITDNETRLVIQNGTVMSSDVLGLARHLVNKYNLIKLPIYHEDGSKYFEYSFNEDMKCSSLPLPFLLTKTIALSFFLTKTIELFNQLGYTNELEEISLELNLPKESNHSADYHAKCLLRISFLDKDDKTKRPSELYFFDMNGLKWVKKGEEL